VSVNEDIEGRNRPRFQPHTSHVEGHFRLHYKRKEREEVGAARHLLAMNKTTRTNRLKLRFPPADFLDGTIASKEEAEKHAGELFFPFKNENWRDDFEVVKTSDK
jgi:hypothetical protein